MAAAKSNGLGIKTVLILVVAILFAGFIQTLYTESPLRQLIDEGAGSVSNQTDYTISISDKDRLSDLAMLTLHRALDRGCKGSGETGLNPQDQGPVYFQNSAGWRKTPGSVTSGEIIEFEDTASTTSEVYGIAYDGGGYKNLEGTYLGRYPECFAAPDTYISDPDYAGEAGNDMEGVIGRERFEIKEPITLVIPPKIETRTRTNVGSYSYTNWLERDLKGAVRRNYRSISNICQGDEKQGYTGMLGPSTAVRYFMFFPRSTPQERLKSFSSNSMWYTEYPGQSFNLVSGGTVTDGPYCSGTRKKYTWDAYTITLCPGDQGVIQVNKFAPNFQGEANDAHHFPSIRITELGEECAGEEKPPIVRVEGTDKVSKNRLLRTNFDKLRTKLEFINRGLVTSGSPGGFLPLDFRFRINDASGQLGKGTVEDVGSEKTREFEIDAAVGPDPPSRLARSIDPEKGPVVQTVDLPGTSFTGEIRKCYLQVEAKYASAGQGVPSWGDMKAVGGNADERRIYVNRFTEERCPGSYVDQGKPASPVMTGRIIKIWNVSDQTSEPGLRRFKVEFKNTGTTKFYAGAFNLRDSMTRDKKTKSEQIMILEKNEVGNMTIEGRLRTGNWCDVDFYVTGPPIPRNYPQMTVANTAAQGWECPVKNVR